MALEVPEDKEDASEKRTNASGSPPVHRIVSG
jgi:hypothetical protein